MSSPPAGRRIDALRTRRAGRLPRPEFATVAILAALTVLGQPAIAAADTARIVLPDALPFSGPVRAAIAVTAADGPTTTLGPYAFRAEPSALRRSPDGRYFAVLVGNWSTDERGLTIVPTDGSAPFEVPPRTRRGGPYDTEPENFSWTFDSGEVVLGNTDAENGPAAKVVLRCSVARRRCAAIPGVDGFAAAVPGGIVTSTALDTLTVETSVFLPGDSSPVEPGTLQVLRKRWRSRTAFVGPKTWALAGRRASLLDGLHGATAIVGGPAGALLTQDRYRLRLGHRRGQSVVQLASKTRRWILVRPDRGTRTVVAPRLTVPKPHSAPIRDPRRLRPQRAYVRPRAPIGSRGWLAVTGVPAANGGTEGLVLTTITPGGRAAFFRTGGQIASATHLVRSVVRGAPAGGTASLDVVGHEATTNAAIVGLHWLEGSAETVFLGGSESDADQVTMHAATLRVPLDGRTAPTLINREREQAAW